MSPVPTPTPKHIVSRELLERMQRALLVRLLEPHTLFLEARRVKLAPLAETAQDDLSLVHPLHDALNSGDPQLPPVLATDLPALDAIATEGGHERLRVADRDKALPQGRVGHETLAAIAYLDHPALFAAARMTTAAARTPDAYAEYEAKSKCAPSFERARLDALGAALAAILALRGRPEFCEALVTRYARETVIDFVFGRLPATHERLTEALARSQVTDVLTRRVRCSIDHETSRLGAQGYPFEREAIRALVGEHLFGDGAHFVASDIYSLAALTRDMEAALSPAPEIGLVRIELRSVRVRRADGVSTTHSYDDDLRASSAADDVRAAIDAGGRVERAKLAIQLAERNTSVVVELAPPDKLTMRRTDDALVDRVRAVLAYKRLMATPVHAEAHADARPVEQA